MEGRKLKLSDMPEAIIVHILSKLRDRKEVVRSSVLSTQWRSLWRCVPFSVEFYHDEEDEEKIADFVASSNRKLYYWRYSQNIPTFGVLFHDYEKLYVKDVDIWLHFATQVAVVQDLTLLCNDYELPQFTFKNKSLRTLTLHDCTLEPYGSVNWSSLISLSIKSVDLSDSAMEKVLSGCPNLEILTVGSCYLHRLEIPNNSLKPRELIIKDSRLEDDDLDLCFEICAPFIRKLQILGSCFAIRLRNVASLVTAVLGFDFRFYCDDEGNSSEDVCLKELLHSVAHVQNLELSPWCTECLSILESKGWQFPPSSRKFLKIGTVRKQLDFTGLCCFLQSSSDLETLVIHWNYDDEPGSTYFERHDLDCPLLHLKIIKIIYFHGSPSRYKLLLSLVKYFLKNASVLEKFVIVREASRKYVKMEEELLSLPKSSPHASVVFSQR